MFGFFFEMDSLFTGEDTTEKKEDDEKYSVYQIYRWTYLSL